MATKVKPIAYPEIISPGDWSVEIWEPGGALRAPCTADGKMFLPAGNSKFAREVKFHELLHVGYSPREVPDPATLGSHGVTGESLLAAEDCRVNLKGMTIRPHDAIGSDDSYLPDAYLVVTQKSERGMARLTAALLGYVSTDKVLDKLQEDLRALQGTDTLPEWLREHAEALRSTLRDVRYGAPDYVDTANMRFSDAVHLAEWLDTFPDDSVETKKGKGSEEGEGDYEQSPGYGNSSNAKWGDMKIETPPLTVGRKTALGRRTIPCDEGARLVHFNRLATGEVFGRPRKAAVPDAVLIDQSGSMHWNAKKLAELVKAMPVGVIAGYSGAHGKGVLRILAKDGKMVAPGLVKSRYGGNEVDGPALRWLSKQRGRKVWVSDEGVCSDVSHDDEALAADCAEVCKAAGIRVTCSTEPADIMRALRGMGRKRE